MILDPIPCDVSVLYLLNDLYTDYDTQGKRCIVLIKCNRRIGLGRVMYNYVWKRDNSYQLDNLQNTLF